MAAIPDAPLVVDVSGGQDCRAVCAALASGRIGGAGLTLHSVEARESEFGIARLVADCLALPLNRLPEFDCAPRVQHEGLAVWHASNAGIYDFLTAPGARCGGFDYFGVSGHGGELYKGNYGWKPMSAFANADPLLEATTQGIARQGLESFGVDPEAPAASEWHYLGYRNAIHSGRFTAVSHFNVRPLMQAGLVRLAQDHALRVGPGAVYRNSVITDLIAALSPDLASLHFDKPEKRIARASLERGARIARRLPAPRPYRILGSPFGQQTGPLGSPLRRARSQGFGGPLVSARINDLTRSILDRAAPRLPSEIETRLRDLATDVPDGFTATTKASRHAAKVLSLSLIFGDP